MVSGQRAEMIQVCREELFPNKTLTVIGWALVEAAGYRYIYAYTIGLCLICACVCVFMCLNVSSFVESSRKEEDCIVLQCREQNQLCMARSVTPSSLCVSAVCVCVCVCVCVLECDSQCSYNVEDDQVNCFIRIPMEKVEKIVIGGSPVNTLS